MARLYKYRYPDQRSIDALASNSIYLPTSDSFNDPFDGLLIPSDYVYSVQNKEAKKMVGFLDEYAKWWQKMFGVLCLSGNPYSILMWSHYAAEHKGFSVGFKHKESLLSSLRHEGLEEGGYTGFDFMRLSVEYTDRNPFNDFVMDYFRRYKKFKKSRIDAGHEPEFNGGRPLQYILFSTKHSDWAYEKEFRILSTNPGLHFYGADAIDTITFGIRCTEETKKAVRLAVKESGASVKFFSCVRSSTEIGIALQPC